MFLFPISISFCFGCQSHVVWNFSSPAKIFCNLLSVAIFAKKSLQQKQKNNPLSWIKQTSKTRIDCFTLAIDEDIKTRLKPATKENTQATPKPGSIQLVVKSSLSQLLASMVFSVIFHKHIHAFRNNWLPLLSIIGNWRFFEASCQFSTSLHQNKFW